MKKITRLLSLIMVCCMLIGMLGITASAEYVSFSDVAPGAWYYAPIIKSAENGIIAGNPDGTYNPNGELTWAQTITFAVRLHQFNNGYRLYGAADQTGAHWYDVYFRYAINKGIISAAPANPGAVITRADAAIIFAAVLGDYELVNDVPAGYFTDVPTSSPAYKAIYDLAKAGVCNGKPGRVFGLKDSFLRSEVAAIVVRMAGLIGKAVIESPLGEMVFSQLDGRVFTYENPTLGGTTTVTLAADGSFTGRYVYTNTAEADTSYPKGTRYLCNFSGAFTDVTQVDADTYQLVVDYVDTSAEAGKVVIQDGLRYISTIPYGFEEAEVFDLFLSGSYTKDMPECLVNSLIIANDWGKAVPAQVAETVLHNHNAHKALVEDIPASVYVGNLFPRIAGKTFTYANSAEGWATTITVNADGSFTGEYRRAVITDTGKNYPNGTIHTTTFWGAFTEISKHNATHYSVRLRYLYLDNNNIGQQNIKDGYRYVVTKAVGFDKAGYFSIYLPGMEVSKAPAPMTKWLWSSVAPNALPFWVIYNIGGEVPFYAY